MKRPAVLLLLSACQFGLTENGGSPKDEGDTPPRPTPYNLCGKPDGDRAVGTWDKPIDVEGLPFVDEGDTTDSPVDDADEWGSACGPWPRGGPEVVYALTVEEQSSLRIELLVEEGVEIAIHLVKDASLEDGEVSGCIAAEVGVLAADDIPAGDYRIVLDAITPGDEDKGGDYRLAVERVRNGRWQEKKLAAGLTWKWWHDYEAGVVNENFNLFVVDLDERELRARPHRECDTVVDAADGFEALAGINGGFAGASCESLDLVRADGNTFSTNAYADRQRVMAWDDGGAPEFAWVDRGVDYDLHDNAFGSFPSLIENGLVTVDPASADDGTRQARTAAGVTANDEVLLFVADGGTAAGDGLTLAELATTMAEIGAVQAVNLDGGGASTSWVEGCSASGVLNYPLDGGGTVREGARGVPDGVYVF